MFKKLTNTLLTAVCTVKIVTNVSAMSLEYSGVAPGPEAAGPRPGAASLRGTLYSVLWLAKHGLIPKFPEGELPFVVVASYVPLATDEDLKTISEAVEQFHEADADV